MAEGVRVVPDARDPPEARGEIALPFEGMAWCALRYASRACAGSFRPRSAMSPSFAKSFASAVGVDRTEIGDQLRTEMGGSRPEYSTPAEVFEPADPARTMRRSRPTA